MKSWEPISWSGKVRVRKKEMTNLGFHREKRVQPGWGPRGSKFPGSVVGPVSLNLVDLS